jgi:hypothetical protein
MGCNWKTIMVAIMAGVAFVVALLFFSGTTQVADESLKYELNALGQSIYEYHAATGQWPSRPDDLARTSLPLRLHYWRSGLENGSIVIVFHDNLKPDPRENSSVVLAYHNKGLRAWLGRQWVCWGDLRTEYISTTRLNAALNSDRH